MNKSILQKVLIALIVIAGIALPLTARAHQPKINTASHIDVSNYEISKAYYSELVGSPQVYRINADKQFDMYTNLLVPLKANPNGRYDMKIEKITSNGRELVAQIPANSVNWNYYYEPFGADSYLKGSEYQNNLAAGNYEITISSNDNLGKYVLAIGLKEQFLPADIVEAYQTIPDLKRNYFNSSVAGFIRSPLGIAYLIVFLLVGVLIGVVLWRMARRIFMSSKNQQYMYLYQILIGLVGILIVVYSIWSWNTFAMLSAGIILYSARGIKLLSRRNHR